MCTVFNRPYVSLGCAVASGMALSVSCPAVRTRALVARHNSVPKHGIGSAGFCDTGWNPPTPQYPLIAVPYGTESTTQNQHRFFCNNNAATPTTTAVHDAYAATFQLSVVQKILELAFPSPVSAMRCGRNQTERHHVLAAAQIPTSVEVGEVEAFINRN